MPHGLLSCLRFIPKRCAVKIPGTWRLAFQDLWELQISHLWNGRTDISPIYLKSSNRNLWKNTLKNIKCFTNVDVLLLVLPGSLLPSVLRSESLKIQVARTTQIPSTCTYSWVGWSLINFVPAQTLTPIPPSPPMRSDWLGLLPSDNNQCNKMQTHYKAKLHGD